MRKHTFLLVTCCSLYLALPRQAIAQSPGYTLPGMEGMRMVPDTDPFTPNTFIGSFSMDMTAGENGKHDITSTIHYFTSSEKTLLRMEQGAALTDHKAKLQYMLMDMGGGKQAMRMAKMKMILSEKNGAAAGKEPRFAETGETRLIEGHTCKKVIAQFDDGTWTGWVTEDIKAPIADIMRSLGGAQGAKGMDKLKGFPLEYTWTSTDGKETVTCVIKDLKTGTVDENLFSLDGYSVMEVPGVGR